ncbi:MAG: hypothetical protein EA396_01810 [Anaerolineaceae bacterium]|nr:MAG: hypothetical protein EA396_01810 [Anaerolineaceae bacterium]
MMTDSADEKPTETVAERGMWGNFRRWLGRGEDDLQDRLFALDDAIAHHPSTAINYVLRGECYLQIGYNQLAERDFEQALELGRSALARSAWGFGAQVAQDRAVRGLRIARRR